MDYLASKTDVEQMKTAVLVQTKVMISEAVDPIKSEFHTLKDRIDLLEQRLAIGEARVDETLAQKVQGIGKAIAELKLAPRQVARTTNSSSRRNVRRFLG